MGHRQPGKGLKRWGPKHTSFTTRESAHAVDRAIERRTRQAGQAECRDGLAEAQEG